MARPQPQGWIALTSGLQIFWFLLLVEGLLSHTDHPRIVVKVINPFYERVTPDLPLRLRSGHAQLETTLDSYRCHAVWTRTLADYATTFPSPLLLQYSKYSKKESFSSDVRRVRTFLLFIGPRSICVFETRTVRFFRKL